MFIKSLVFLCFFASSLASLAFQSLPPKPEKYEHLEGCYIENLDAVLPFGTSAPAKGRCKEFRCKSDKIVHVTCGLMKFGKGAHAEEDKSKPYPDCCPKIVKD